MITTIHEQASLQHYQDLLRNCGYFEEIEDFFHDNAEALAKLAGHTSWPAGFCIHGYHTRDGAALFYTWWHGEDDWLEIIKRLNIQVRWCEDSAHGLDALLFMPFDDFPVLAAMAKLNSVLP